MKTYSELIRLFENAKSKKEITEKVLPEYPEIAPITNCKKCTSYWFDIGIVYLTEPAYDAYTLSEYDYEDKCFYLTKIHMEDDCRKDDEMVADLENVIQFDNWDYIRKFYEIPETHVRKIKTM